MKTRSLPDRTQKLNDILKAIRKYAEEPEENIVRWLVLEEGYSLAEVARGAGMTPERMRQKFPDLSKEAKEKRA